MNDCTYDYWWVKTTASFWATFKLLYFNDCNCFPAVLNKNCCFQTERWAVIQSQGFTAIHNLLGLLFKMPAESHDWFTTFTQLGTRVCSIHHSAILCSSITSHCIFFSSKSIPQYECSYCNIFGKSGTTQLTHAPSAEYFSVLPCIYLLWLLKSRSFFGHMSLHLRSHPYKLPDNEAKF